MNTESERIVGLYRDISQFIIGTVVEEDDTFITLKRALMVSVEKDPTKEGVIPRFFPISLLTIDPPFHVMPFLNGEQTIDFPVRFRKDMLLRPVEALNDPIIQMYHRNFQGIDSKPLPQPEDPKSPEENIITLY